jgi:hypothetical protein
MRRFLLGFSGGDGFFVFRHGLSFRISVAKNAHGDAGKFLDNPQAPSLGSGDENLRRPKLGGSNLQQ